jgi:hypothetical protein
MEMVRINERRKLVEVAPDKDVIQEAPAFDNNYDITPEYEDRVHRYFELERQSSSSGRGLRRLLHLGLAWRPLCGPSASGGPHGLRDAREALGHLGVGGRDHTRGDLGGSRRGERKRRSRAAISLAPGTGVNERSL